MFINRKIYIFKIYLFFNCELENSVKHLKGCYRKENTTTLLAHQLKEHISLSVIKVTKLFLKPLKDTERVIILSFKIPSALNSYSFKISLQF